MRSNKPYIKKLEQTKVRLAKERDILRDIESEISSLADVTDEALEYLNDAIEKLSEQV